MIRLSICSVFLSQINSVREASKIGWISFLFVFQLCAEAADRFCTILLSQIDRRPLPPSPSSASLPPSAQSIACIVATITRAIYRRRRHHHTRDPTSVSPPPSSTATFRRHAHHSFAHSRSSSPACLVFLVRSLSPPTARLDFSRSLSPPTARLDSPLAIATNRATRFIGRCRHRATRFHLLIVHFLIVAECANSSCHRSHICLYQALSI